MKLIRLVMPNAVAGVILDNNGFIKEVAPILYKLKKYCMNEEDIMKWAKKNNFEVNITVFPEEEDEDENNELCI